jgi:23S rRNA-/tRNA-specific pseudouridylate synthase
VDPYRDGWTLRDFLVHRFRYHDASRWDERLRSGVVRVNDRVAEGATVVRKGDRVGYEIEHAEPPVDFRYDLLHEDHDVLAVSKSGNLPVHGGGKFLTHTLIAKLREQWGDELRLAHRLDRETSGVVLLAKNVDAARALEVAFRERQVRKAYVAVLRGETPAAWTVDGAIARREPAEPPYFRVVDNESGKPAITHFRRLAVGVLPHPGGETGDATRDGFHRAPEGIHAAPEAALSLVAAEPLSGRTNQIRVHAAHAGHPVLGDKIYGVPPDVARSFVRDGESADVLRAAGATRHLLHCARLELRHPRTGSPLRLEAPLPADFLGLFPGPEPGGPDPGGAGG